MVTARRQPPPATTLFAPRFADASGPPQEATLTSPETAHASDPLRSALRGLDTPLERAVAFARSPLCPAASTDSFRGLFIRDGEAASLRAREPGARRRADRPQGGTRWSVDARGLQSPWGRMAKGRLLSPFDLDDPLIALAGASEGGAHAIRRNEETVKPRSQGPRGSGRCPIAAGPDSNTRAELEYPDGARARQMGLTASRAVSRCPSS